MFVIYDPETTRVVKTAKTLGAAKGARTRIQRTGVVVSEYGHRRKPRYNGKDIDVATLEIAEGADFYENIEKKVERTNLMSGAKFMEGVNTPPYMSPSCESYWSR